MELMEVIRNRRSVRKYKSKLVSEKDIEYVLQAARLAPSWKNDQCWRYIVVTDADLRKKITAGGRWADRAAEAPVIIVGCADPTKSGDRNGKQYYMLDMGISMEHLMLAATERGLGTCCIGLGFDEKVVKETLGIPENIRVVALTPLGYADESPALKDRKSLEEMTSRNKW
jgi:nitroreductase